MKACIRLAAALAFLGCWNEPGNGPGGSCPEPDYVFAPRTFADADGNALHVQSLLSDSGAVYFSTADGAYRVPVEGGEPLQLAPGPLAGGHSPLLRQGGRIFLFRRMEGKDVLDQLPASGSAWQRRLDSVPAFAGETAHRVPLGMDDTHFYWQAAATKVDTPVSPNDVTYNLNRMPWADSGQAETVLAQWPHAFAEFRKAGDSIYFIDRNPFGPGKLHVLPDGAGAPVFLRELSPSFEGRIKTDGDRLYLILINALVKQELGVARLEARAGSNPEFVYRTPYVPRDFWFDGGGFIIHDYLGVDPDSAGSRSAEAVYAAPAGGPDRLVTCVREGEGAGNYRVALRDKTGKTLFLLLEESQGGRAGIIRVNIP